MGLASIWAFVGGKYPDVPEDPRPAPAVSHSIAPAQLAPAHVARITITLSS